MNVTKMRRQLERTGLSSEMLLVSSITAPVGPGLTLVMDANGANVVDDASGSAVPWETMLSMRRRFGAPV